MENKYTGFNRRRELRRNGDKECSLLKALIEEKIRRLETRIADHERYDNVRFKNLDESEKIRAKVLDHRLAALNELRSEVLKDRDLFAQKNMLQNEVQRREEKEKSMSNWVSIVDKKITTLETNYSNRINRADMKSIISLIIAFLGLGFVLLRTLVYKN